MLNKSNAKWISVGVTCTPRIAFPEGNGFVAEGQLSSEKGSMVIGNERCMRSLFKAIRDDSECQYMHIATKSDYTDCSETLFIINKASFGGTRCLQIINQSGQSCFLSLQAIDDLLKRELVILALLKSTAKRSDECESHFMSLLREARADYNSAIEKMITDEEIISMDIFANFTDIFHLCLNIESSKNQINGIIMGDASNNPQPSALSIAQLSPPSLPQTQPNGIIMGNASNNPHSSALTIGHLSLPQINDGSDEGSIIKARRTYSKEK